MLEIKDLNIKAGNFHLTDISFEVKKGEYYFLLGRSGAGKSLILNAIAGIRHIYKGIILLDGQDITHLPINKRDVGMVFQNLAVFPHKTVYQNIAFPLECRQIKREVINIEVERIAHSLEIETLLKRKPSTLSGGEYQRAALARTLIMKPKILILDEPLTSLDIILKEEMEDLLASIHHSGQSILHVTHDYQIVNKLADRISILENGSIIQSGSVKEVSKSPKCLLAEKL